MKKKLLAFLTAICLSPVLVMAQDTHTVQEVSVQDQDDLQKRIKPTLLEMDYLTTGEVSLPYIDPQKTDLSDCSLIFASQKDSLGIVRRLKKDGSFAGYQTGPFEMFRKDCGSTVTDYRFVFPNELKEKMLGAYLRVEAEGYYPVNAMIFGSDTWHMRTNDVPKSTDCYSLRYEQIRMKKISPPVASFGQGFSTQVGETYSLEYLGDEPDAKETGWTFDAGENGFQWPYDNFMLLTCTKERLFVYPFDKKFSAPMAVSVDAAKAPDGHQGWHIAASGARVDPVTWTLQTIPTKLENNKYVFNITEGGIYNVIPSGPPASKTSK